MVDGGSTDGSADEIRKYDGRLAWWCSEPDKGIYDAMNKGLAHATGRYVLFLNSGDYFIKPSSLASLVSRGLDADIIVCRQKFISENGKISSSPKLCAREMDMRFFLSSTLPHQSTLISLDLIRQIGGYDITYKVSADWVLWVKVVVEQKCTVQTVPMFITYMEDGGVSSDIEKCHTDMSRYLEICRQNGVLTWNAVFDAAILSRQQDFCNRTAFGRITCKAAAWLGRWLVRTGA